MPTPAEMMRLRLHAEVERRNPKGAFDVMRPNGDDSDHPLAWLTRPAKDSIAGTVHTVGSALHGAAKVVNYLNQDKEDTSMPYPRRPQNLQPRGGYDVDPDLDVPSGGGPPDDGSAEQAVAGIQAIVEGLDPSQQSEFLAQLRTWIEEQQGAGVAGAGGSSAPAGSNPGAADRARRRMAQDVAFKAAARHTADFHATYPGAASIDRGQVPAWPRRFG